MKIRMGFVSNSSSSSFVIRKEDLTVLQFELINNHMEVGKEMGIYTSWHEADTYDTWSIYDQGDKIEGYTGLDNFSMEDFLEKIGVPENRIEWGD